MAAKPVALPRKEDIENWEAELAQAHQASAEAARELSDDPGHAFRANLARVQVQAIRIGHALERVARAERGCGRFHERQHDLVMHDRTMLEHERQAYLNFEKLSHELESDPPNHDHIAALARDISGHMESARTAHRAKKD